MGLIDRGWTCTCDRCGNPARVDIGGYTRREIIRVARALGFVSVGNGEYWFCSQVCKQQWLAGQQNKS